MALGGEVSVSLSSLSSTSGVSLAMHVSQNATGTQSIEKERPSNNLDIMLFKARLLVASIVVQHYALFPRTIIPDTGL